MTVVQSTQKKEKNQFNRFKLHKNIWRVRRVQKNYYYIVGWFIYIFIFVKLEWFETVKDGDTK